MGCSFSTRRVSHRGPNDDNRTEVDALAEVNPVGNITAKISAEERTIRTARIIKNATVYERYDFVFDRILGTGISGEVREAISRTTSEHVAIKTLSTVNLTPKKFEMLVQECEIYLRMDHPNICKLFEVYEDESAVHLVMELCSGKELYERLATQRRYTERDAAQVLFGQLEAINYCHMHSVVHRDLKLENWVYASSAPDAPLKLIDFGMSKIFNEGTVLTAVHGTVYYVAPEVLAGRYNNLADIWSLGVIAYMLLSGSPPFGGQHDYEIINKIKTAEVSFEGPRWSGISQEAKEFVSALLTRDPSKRPTALEAMNHPWLKRMLRKVSEDSTVSEIDTDVLKNIRLFSRQNAMRRAALGLIAMSMGSAQVAQVEEEFRKLDKNKMGTITLAELTDVLKRQLHMSQQEAKLIFNRLDLCNDHEIHYTEFVAAALQAKLLLNEKYIKEAFQKFDVNNTGFISEEDLRRVIGDQYKGEDVGQILRQADFKKNGYLDYEEFYKALMDNSLEEASMFGDTDSLSDMPTTSRRLIMNKLLELSDQRASLALDNPGPATFTWGSCRRDARFKFDPKMLESLLEERHDDEDRPARDTVSEQGASSEKGDI
jgi:calcium-dependent protein kinase